MRARGAAWPIGAAVPAGVLLPLSSPGPQGDVLPLVMPRRHRSSMLSRPSDHRELTVGFPSGRKCGLGNERSTVLSRRFISPNSAPLFKHSKLFASMCFISFSLSPYERECSRSHLSWVESHPSVPPSTHPSIHPSLHIFIKYPCVTGVGGQW